MKTHTQSSTRTKTLVSSSLVAGAAAITAGTASGAVNSVDTTGLTDLFGSTLIDLDGDAIDDFEIKLSNVHSSAGFSIVPQGNNAVFSENIDQGQGGTLYVVNLAEPAQTPSPGYNMAEASISDGLTAPFNHSSFIFDPDTGTIALEFDISGSTHYGFLDIETFQDEGGDLLLSITNGGYGMTAGELPPGVPGANPVPEGGSLGGLAALAAGIAAAGHLRRRRAA